MMSIIEGLYYLLIWFVLSCGFAFVIASAFFGIPDNDENDFKRRTTSLD